MNKILPIYNTEHIPGQNYKLLGLVKGSMIQSKHLGRDIGNVLKSIVGGELRGYGEMLNEARALATKRMMQGAAEILVYGTAVKFVDGD